MKQKYLFTRNLDEVNPQSVFFCLFVGTSRRERKALTKVADYAERNSCYLILWSEEVSSMLYRIAEKMYPGTRCPFVHLNMPRVEIQEFASLCLDNQVEAYEAHCLKPKSYFSLLSILEPDIVFANRRQNLHDPASEPSRRYLSHGASVLANGYGKAVAIILAVFLLAGWLQGHEYLFY